MSQYKCSIPETLIGARIDKAISILYSELSRNQVQKAIKNEQLTINDRIISNLSTKVKENDIINIMITNAPQDDIQASNIPLDIVYEDEDLLVINKSSNMSSHPGSGDYSHTLVNALLYHSRYLSDIAGEMRPGIVHRLDKTTSGLMVVAKNNAAHQHLANQIISRALIRRYKALIWSTISPSEGVIDLNIGRSHVDRKRMTTLKHGGKTASTHYRTLQTFCNGLFSLVECKLDTGRTHQIRVHMSHTGNSIVGDQVYGNNRRKINSCPADLREILQEMTHQALHSFYISFLHPNSEHRMEFTQDIPKDYSKLVNYIDSYTITN